MNSKTILSIFVAFLFSFALVFIPVLRNEEDANLLAMDIARVDQADMVYRVYLEGKSIGIVSSKEELENYIDKEQNEIKEKYNVDKVYAPNDLDIVKEYTFNEKLSTTEEIYQKIKEMKGPEAFTINGYKVFIGGVEEETEEGTVQGEDVVFYVLDKDVLYEAMERTIKVFVDEEDYENYLNGTQEEIVYTGKTIENLYIENKKTITQERIPAGEKIYTDVDSLSQFLLFGTDQEQEQYVVQEGDTIEDIAFNNKISTEEFLIANSDFNSASDLLYPGQVVTIGILDPQFRLTEEDFVVEEKVVEYETKYEDDNTKYVGYEKVKQEGQDGLSVVSVIRKKVNGEIVATATTSEEKIKPSVDRIVIRGTRQYSSSTDWNQEVPVSIGSWVWPTAVPYTINSPFGWRWGKLHEGIDIGGCGYGSPIKAANNGVVVQSGYTSTNGNYITIKHSNGYYTMYAHMATRYKAVGATVYAGDVIGLMGESGFATGVHLHFAIYNGMPYRGGVALNPFKTVYR